MDNELLSEEILQEVYNWVDEMKLSKPKKNIARDFSDGLMMAEIMKHYFPKLVQIHNYPSANSGYQKLTNWNTLNNKVFKKLGFQIEKQDIEKIINSTPNFIEKILYFVKSKIDPNLASESNLKIKMRIDQEKQLPSNKEIRKLPPRIMQDETNEKDKIIEGFRETIDILELKIKKLEQIIKMKDAKIESMINKIDEVKKRK